MKYTPILIILSLIWTAGATSYIDTGTMLIMEDVTYTFDSQWNLSGISRFPSTGNNVYITIGDIGTLGINASCTSDCLYNLTIDNTPNARLNITRNNVKWEGYTLTGNTLVIHGETDAGEEDRYTIQGVTKNYNIYVCNSTGVKITGTKLFDFHAYNTTQVEVDIPETNCRYAFKNAKIQSNPDWGNCNFNITLPQSRVVHVESYNIPMAIPHSIIIALGASGLSMLMYIYYRLKHRRRRGR